MAAWTPSTCFICVAASFVAVAALSWLMVRAIRRGAERHRVLDIPNHRSSHSRPVALGGGLAIVAICLVGWWSLQAFRPDGNWSHIAGFGVGAILIAAVSWIDDLRSVSSCMRFAVHSLAAILVILAYGSWSTVALPSIGDLSLGWLGLPIVFLWIVGLTNAYNFMDGSDGMAGSQAVIAGLGWACLGWLADSPAITCLSLLLAAGSLGFLLHNWPPARIFMGDAGSAFLGYSFAVLPLLGLRENGPLAGISPILGLLLVWPFVFDAAFTFLRRLRKGENVFAAHRSHLYQRLIIAGHSHRFVMLLYSTLAIVGAAAGVFWLEQPVEAYWCSAVLLPSLAWMLCRFVARQEWRALQAAEKARIEPVRLPLRRAA